MTIEFFWSPGGPFALRCLMTLAVKDLPYHSRRLDLSRQEHRTADFLAINHLGTLPVLRDKATVVRESQAIMFYLDRAYPNVPVYGETAAEAGKIMQEICEQQTYADPVLRLLIGALVFNRSTPTDEIKNAIVGFEALLGDVNRRLALTGWLAGKRLTAADINLYPLLRSVIEGLSADRAGDLGLELPVVGSFVNVTAWMERLKPFAVAEQ